MNEIHKELDQLKLPDPIFGLYKTWGDNYRLEPLGVPTQLEGGPIKGLVNQLVITRFNTETLAYEVDKHGSSDRVMSAIFTYVASFLESHMKQKQPTSTKLYKFCRHELPKVAEMNEPITNAMIALYKHMIDNHAEIAKGRDNKYSVGCLAVLNALMEKYSGA